MLTNIPFNSPVSFLTAANPSFGKNPASPSSSSQYYVSSNSCNDPSILLIKSALDLARVRAFMRRDEPFLRQSVRLSLRILSCDEREIVILTAFVRTFCDIRLTAPATLFDPRCRKAACFQYG